MSNKALAEAFVQRNAGKLIWRGMTALEFFYGFETDDTESVQFYSPNVEVAYDAIREIIKETGERLLGSAPLHTEQGISVFGLNFQLRPMGPDFLTMNKLQIMESGQIVLHPETVMMEALAKYIASQSPEWLTALSFGEKYLLDQCNPSLQTMIKRVADSAEQKGLGYDQHLRVLKQEADRRRDGTI